MFKYRRVLAFLLDVMLVGVLAVMLSNNPKLNKAYDYQDEYMKAFTEEVNTLSDNQVITNPSDIYNYYEDKLALPMINMFKVQVYIYIIFLSIVFLYYVVFTYFNDGKTLGCAIFKLKITKKNDEKAGIFNLMMRSLFMGTSFVYLVPIVCLINIIVPRVLPLNISFMVLLTSVSFAFVFELVFILYFLLNKNNMTIQDYLSNTKVIDTKK
jgi:uncharacterized RDD family membrane protein YckC